MLLALRKDPPKGATLWQRFACWLIRARLVSQYCHGGIVINGRLYHATATRGLHCLKPGEWTPENWDLVVVDGNEVLALLNFEAYKGAQYDWFSLLAFAGLIVRDSSRMYCFEWCFFAITGKIPTDRITPEILLKHKKC